MVKYDPEDFKGGLFRPTDDRLLSSAQCRAEVLGFQKEQYREHSSSGKLPSPLDLY